MRINSWIYIPRSENMKGIQEEKVKKPVKLINITGRVDVILQQHNLNPLPATQIHRESDYTWQT